MNVGRRIVVSASAVVLLVGLTSLACSQDPTEDTKPVVTVYASPT